MEKKNENPSASAQQAEPVAWGAFRVGGDRDGQLYAFCKTRHEIETYITQVHQSSDSVTLRDAPLYAAPAPSAQRAEHSKATDCPMGCFEGECGWEKQGQSYACPRKSSSAPAPTASHPVVAMLIEVARSAYLALDESEEREGEDGRIHVLDDTAFDDLSNALDKLDELPDDQPGCTMGPAQKAEWALRSLPAPSASPMRNAGCVHCGNAGCVGMACCMPDGKSGASPAALTDAQTRGQLESLARHSYGGRFPVYMSGDDARALLAASPADPRESDHA